MSYVDRDQAGKITGAYPHQQYPGQEFIADSDPDYIAFINPLPSLHDRLKAILITLDATIQAQFGEVAAGVDLAVQNGRPDVAKLELQALTLPSELEPVRTQLLEEIDRG